MNHQERFLLHNLFDWKNIIEVEAKKSFKQPKLLNKFAFISVFKTVLKFLILDHEIK